MSIYKLVENQIEEIEEIVTKHNIKEIKVRKENLKAERDRLTAELDLEIAKCNEIIKAFKDNGGVEIEEVVVSEEIV